MTNIELGEEKRVARTVREQRRLVTGAITVGDVVISESITGLPPHEFRPEIKAWTRRVFARVFQHKQTIFVHRRDCRRCAMERERAVARRLLTAIAA